MLVVPAGRARCANRSATAALRALRQEPAAVRGALGRGGYDALVALCRTARGTFFHARRVADLVGLVFPGPEHRAACLLHDVGKLDCPSAYGENMAVGCRPGDDVLIGHVDRGLCLAAELDVPPLARAAIAEHHGTLPVSDAACYPGPAPRSLFTATLMLADAFEAVDAQGALTPATAAAIVEHRRRHGQFDLVDPVALLAGCHHLLAALLPLPVAA